jgi:hypothetical protein
MQKILLDNCVSLLFCINNPPCSDFSPKIKTIVNPTKIDKEIATIILAKPILNHKTEAIEKNYFFAIFQNISN